MALYAEPQRTPQGLSGRALQKITVKTPLLEIVEHTTTYLILRNDSDEFKQWLITLRKKNTEWFRTYCPRNKQTPDAISDTFKITLTDQTRYYKSVDGKNYISSLSEFVQGMSCKCLISTPLIWVGKEYYGNTWKLDQAVILRQREP
uniref:Uncharacterized protein n=1 Tax=viral metagenome TaxID=1070528 RepID=A0A6C0K9H3_9ZZZZ